MWKILEFLRSLIPDVNQEQVKGVLRVVVPPVLTYLAAKGVIGADTTGELAAVAVTVGASVWSFLVHRPDNVAATALANDPAHIVKAVAALPEVKAVEIEPTPRGVALADAVGTAPDAVVKIADK